MNIDTLSLNIKQPARFDHLKTFVHHRRRINRYFLSYGPVRMGQRLR